MAPAARVFPAQPLQALGTILSFTAVLWVVEFYDQLTGERLDQDGIVPRSVDGLDGIVWAPLLHGGWAHLVANTLPFVVFGFLVLANGIARFVLVTAVIWVIAGLGVWLTAPAGSVTVGMSGVIFGWLTYLLVRGFFARSGTQIVLALVVFFLWGGILSACSRGRRASRGRGTCPVHWPGCSRPGWWPAGGPPRRRGRRLTSVAGSAASRTPPRLDGVTTPGIDAPIGIFDSGVGGSPWPVR